MLLAYRTNPSSETEEVPEVSSSGLKTSATQWLLLFPLVVFVWDAWESLVEKYWGKADKLHQLFTFAITLILSGVSLYVCEQTKRSHVARILPFHSKIVGFLGILCTTSTWCALEKSVEILFPAGSGTAVYCSLAFFNALLIVGYEHKTKQDIFAGLVDII